MRTLNSPAVQSSAKRRKQAVAETPGKPGEPRNRIQHLTQPVVVAEKSAARSRAKKLHELAIEYVDHASFADPSQAALILGPAPATARKDRLKPPAGTPAYLASLYEFPLLTRAEEGYHFRKFNFLKYSAARLIERLSLTRPSPRTMSRVEELLRQAEEVKNLLVRTNLRLVVAVARKCAPPSSDFFEVVSDGNISLMRAVEKFDFSRGFKFSTYATWAIRRNFARSIPAEYNRLGRFRTGHEELFQNSHDDRANQFAEERTNRQQNRALIGMVNQLADRERDIIALRFGLETPEPLTLQEVGSHFGVSKERIRQLEARALQRLREIAMEQKLDLGV